ncbi:uncharacterized protein TRAVEDRAFT_72384 [Trametes versicolor FP-101664 SS1]|uniref:uncharacterized protein n=1 Tax=Trametes versicolor (strain FP-101664) TaxID=717944 RepID=UPI00046246AF|nr:uncharacterized protein TRAVEDRAFT_72384 [Trametes versicolor FP-101664 SS1]EIW57220.1 hypothetical protein TRAVEDRAFT_72384 [Trametes versicolor FP-101664 SS1]
MYAEQKEQLVCGRFVDHTRGTVGFDNDDQPTEGEGQPRSSPLEHVPEHQTTTELATSGLDSIPPELLGLIFEHTAGAAAVLNCELIRITHVCRYWRDVALHSPALWSHIALMHPAAVEVFLARSQTLPLRISVDMKAKRGSKTSKGMRIQALQVLLGQAACGRILSLKINDLPGSDDFNWVMQDIARAALQLERLSIERCFSDVVIIPSADPAYFDGLPKLQSLTLSGETPPWFRKTPNALTTIYLEWPLCNVPTVVRLLERSPSLEHLTIRGFFGEDAERGTGKVTLAHLKTLRLQGLSSLVTAALLSNLILPSEHTNISLCDPKSWGPSFAALIPTHNMFNGLPFSALQGLKHVQLTWKNGLRTLRAYRSSELAHSAAPALQVHTAMSIDLAEGFLINWPIDASHVETVDIYGDTVDLPEVLEQAWVWATMLSAVPAMRTLRVRAVTESTLQAILSALQSPGADTMACPQLETLVLVQVSLVGQSWNALAGTARLRGPLVGAGGCLAKIVVERPVTEPPTSDDQVLRLNKMTGVEMILTESQ